MRCTNAWVSASSHEPVRSPPASPFTRLRHVRVRPRGFGAGRRARRVCRRHLTEDEERLGRDLTHAQLGRADGERIHVVGDVNCSGIPRFVGLPRDAAVDRPVDLHRRVVELEPLDVVEQVGRKVLARDEVEIEARRGDVGEDRPSRRRCSRRPRCSLQRLGPPGPQRSIRAGCNGPRRRDPRAGGRELRSAWRRRLRAPDNPPVDPDT